MPFDQCGKFSKAGFFACCDNPKLALWAYFCGCVEAGRTVHDLESEKDCKLWGFLAVLGPIGIWVRGMSRTKLREREGIEGEVWEDFVIHWLCGYCAMVQEARTLRGDEPKCNCDE
eukprot:TRINITY_DN14166_c0_g1_i1.p2 TRINITY_DN14166_c0_g1~~TRINITY_DN14166_c0_g1_i1.p2  ORF type:complete len:116 (+),score=9.69 TRINITY_DN14166_c0_g1_i1:59-406(+)